MYACMLVLAMVWPYPCRHEHARAHTHTHKHREAGRLPKAATACNTLALSHSTFRELHEGFESVATVLLHCALASIKAVLERSSETFEIYGFRFDSSSDNNRN